MVQGRCGCVINISQENLSRVSHIKSYLMCEKLMRFENRIRFDACERFENLILVSLC